MHQYAPDTPMYARNVAPSDPLHDLIQKGESEIVRLLETANENTASDPVLFHQLTCRLGTTEWWLDFGNGRHW